MKKETRLRGALVINTLLVVMEIVALGLSLVNQGMENFEFYTQDSNYFSMVVSLLFCIFAAKELRGEGKRPTWLHILRYVSVSCLMVTLFVVLFVLMPMMGDDAPKLLYEGSMLYQHTLCPILAMISFFAFETEEPLPRSVVGKALLPTVLYAVIAILLNLCRFMEGPYPFLMVYAQPWYWSVLWCVVILGIAAALAFAALWIHNKVAGRMRSLKHAE